MVINNYLLSNKAKKDLEDIFHYISAELMHSESAIKLITEMEQTFVHIVEHP